VYAVVQIRDVEPEIIIKLITRTVALVAHIKKIVPCLCAEFSVADPDLILLCNFSPHSKTKLEFLSRSGNYCSSYLIRGVFEICANYSTIGY
jgi:hypothetical protein